MAITGDMGCLRFGNILPAETWGHSIGSAAHEKIICKEPANTAFAAVLAVAHRHAQKPKVG
jgi:hypothetical protein